MSYSCFLAVLILLCTHASAQCIDPSNCLGAGIGPGERDDTSSLLQSAALHLHGNIAQVQKAFFQNFDEAAENSSVNRSTSIITLPVEEVAARSNSSSTGTPSSEVINLDVRLDLIAGVILVLCSLFIFGMIYMFMDSVASLGLPIASSGEDARVSLLDNAKFLMVCLVIFHHTDGIKDQNFGCSRPSFDQLEGFEHVYMHFHTRTLCFISGILSRSELKAEKLLTNLLLPFMAFCFVIQPLELFINVTWHRHPFPYGNAFATGFQRFIVSYPALQWYLMALIWWRVLASLVKPFSPRMRMLLACKIAALVAYVSTGCLSLPGIKFFPAFVAGQLFPYDKAVSKLKWRPSTAFTGIVVLAAIAIARTFCEPFYLATLDRLPKPDDIVANPRDMPLLWLRSLANTSLELFRSIVFLFWVCPRTNLPFTNAGKYSMYPYLLHWCVLPWVGWVMACLIPLPEQSASSFGSSACVLLLDICVCVGICATMASWPVRFVFSALLEPVWIKSCFIREGKVERL